jgi:hypothetical protein
VLVEAKFASVMMNSRFMNIHTYSGRGLMAADPTGVCVFYSLDVSDEVLGRSALDALSASRWISMDEYAAYFSPEKLKREGEEWLDSVKRIYGYKTRKSVFTGMAKCSIEDMNGVITIRPSTHEKLEAWSGKGITKDDHVVIPSAPTAEAMGAGVRLALSRCK